MIISHWALVSVSGPAQFSHSPVTGVPCSTACHSPLQNSVMQLSLSPSSGGKLAARDAKKSTAAVSPGPATLPDQKPGLASLNNHQTSQSDICINTVTELIHLHAFKCFRCPSRIAHSLLHSHVQCFVQVCLSHDVLVTTGGRWGLTIHGARHGDLRQCSH